MEDNPEAIQYLSDKLSLIFEDFPHDCLFYNEFMADIIKADSSDESSHQSLPVTLVINLLPIASANHWSQNNVEPVFKCNNAKTSYDSILESMEAPFDQGDFLHMKIFELYITLIVGEILFVYLEKTTEPLSNPLVELFKDIFLYYATTELSDDFTALIPFIQKLYGKSQAIWSRDFGLMSRYHFEECYKMLQKAVIEDLNNEEEDSVTPNLKINFYKYLWITPTRKLVSSHVLFLLNHFNHALSSKRLKSSTKLAVLEALKWLLAHLTFDDISVTNSSSSIEEDKSLDPKDDADAIARLLWPSVKTLYQNWLKLTKVMYLKPQAVNVMITILRKAPKNFFVNECLSFVKKIQIHNFFEYKKTFLEGLKLVYEMIKGVEKYGDYTDIWYPLTQIGSQSEGQFSLSFRYSQQKYEWHRIEQYDNSYYEVLSPKGAFDIWFGNSKFSLTERADTVNGWENWKEIMDMYYTILHQISIEDLQYAWEEAIPSLLDLADSTHTFEYNVALKVAAALLSPQERFIEKYKEVWGEDKDISLTLDKLRDRLEAVLGQSIQNYAPDISSYLHMPQASSMISKNSILENSVITLKTLKEFGSNDLSSKSNHIIVDVINLELEKLTLSFIYLIDLMPFLGEFDYSGNNNSEFLSESASTEEISKNPT
jgi:hypothetical protein